MRSRWFDRLHQRIKESSEAVEITLPGLEDTEIKELDKDLDNAELLIIDQDVAARLIEDGSAPDDLMTSFQLPFDIVMFQIDPPVRLPERHGELRGILVTKVMERYRVRAWFEEHRASIRPRYDFTFLPGEKLEGHQKVIVDLLYWLAGYISSSHVLAIRHNRPLGLIRRYLSEGRPAPSSYYTFEAVPKPKQPRMRRRVGEPKPRVTSVHGHFRRAHWHNLPFGRGRRWYPTTWVRSYRRRIPEAEEEVGAAA